jgi:hypothetical protein
MTVICLIPTYGRPIITEICFNNLRRAKDQFIKHSINFVPVATISDDENRRLCQSHNIPYYALPNKPIGMKLDAAIEFIREDFDFDYFMTLGSDNIITEQGVQILADEMHKGALVSGFKDMVFIQGDRMKLYNSTTMFGAGRIINSFVLDYTMKRVGQMYGDKDRGLDGASFRSMKRAGCAGFNYLKGYGIIDIKTSENINSFEAYNVRTQPISDDYRRYIEVKPN